jgi:hypothetical protein
MVGIGGSEGVEKSPEQMVMQIHLSITCHLLGRSQSPHLRVGRMTDIAKDLIPRYMIRFKNRMFW